jgi:hypothetical protein
MDDLNLAGEHFSAMVGSSFRFLDPGQLRVSQ